MHELSYAQGIIRVVQAEQQKQQFTHVLEIRLGIGEFSGVETECLAEFFPFAAGGTAAEGATLRFETIKGQFHCRDCGTDGPADRKKHCCAACGSTNLAMTAGREFRVESLQVE